MRRAPLALVAAMIVVGGCRSGISPPASQPPPPPAATTSEQPKVAGGTLPEIVLTADLSDPPSEWRLVASVPYGADERQLGLSTLPGDLPTAGGHRSPASFAVAGDGSFWILDTAKARLAHFSAAGAYLGAVTGLSYEKNRPAARDVAITDHGMYVLEGDGPERTIRASDFARLSSPITPYMETNAVVISSLFPSSRHVVGWLGGYVDPLGGGPRSFAELDIPGSGQADPLPGLPVGPDRWIDLASSGDQDLEIEFASAAGTSVQPIHVDVVTAVGAGGRRLQGLVGPGIEAALPNAVGILVSVLAYEGDRQIGQRWYLRIGTDKQPIAWERLPDEHRNGELKSRHLAADPDGSVYLMLSTESGEEIYRRP